MLPTPSSPLPALNFEALFDAAPNPYMLMNPALTIVGCNQAYLRVTASKRDAIIGRHVFEAFPSEDVSMHQVRISLERVLRERKPDMLALIHYALPRSTPEGTVIEDRYWSATHVPILDERGEVVLILQHTVDVTDIQELKKAVRAAREGRDEQLTIDRVESDMFRRAQVVQEANLTLESERRFLRRMFEQAPGFICILRGPLHLFELANAAYIQLVGGREVVGKTVRDALPELQGQGFYELLDNVFTTGEPFVGREMPALLQRQPDAPPEPRYVDFVYQPIVESDGSISGIFVQGHDVTDQKHARDELQRYQDHLEERVRERTRSLEESEARRWRAEEALRQAQKMEAIGQLTGGVAHDFNNILQVIAGNLQLIQIEVEGRQQAHQRVQAAISAVDRGAKLAAQLLAFARRQPLEPQAVNLGRLVRGMDDLLRRALGEAIEIETTVADTLWNTFIDPAQVENVLLNLAVNARDAMDGRGKLTIEASNAMLDEGYASQHAEVVAGPYVLLAVSDTGCGMSPETLARAFEPFFTTKAEGHGTGLGLAMVFGFVKQSGGHIKIYSEVGHGTTVRIYLPRTQAAEEMVEDLRAMPIEGGTETILVVEDDPDVRATTVDILADLGYRVLKASDGQSALAIVQSGIPIDLLFTDVVMPGTLRSPELARQAKEIIPDLEVLFTSGYTENAIVHGGRLDPGVSLLSKPYRRGDLARKIRHLLRNRQQRTIATTKPASGSSVERATSAFKILLVEDEPIIQLSTAEMLQSLGHGVVALADAESALARLERETFDVLFTDVSLPGMSGVTLAEEAVRRRPGLRIVFASGYGSVSGLAGRDRPTELTHAITLPKPYDLVAISAALRRLGANR